MKATIRVKKEVELKYLHVAAGVRYWEDATVNGVEDEEGTLIPCRDGDHWCPVIDVDSGKILNWPEGTTADIHYKVCDDGSYHLRDECGDKILSIDQDYVPRILCPEENGHGDYIIMKVDGTGQIANWEFTLEGFSVE